MSTPIINKCDSGTSNPYGHGSEHIENSTNNVEDYLTIHSSTFLNSIKTAKSDGDDDKEREIKENIMILGLQRPSMVADKDRKCCLIYPNDKFKIMFWDILISLCLLITCIMIPFNMAFSDEMDAMTWYNVLLMIVDGFFVGDLFVWNALTKPNQTRLVPPTQTINDTRI